MSPESPARALTTSTSVPDKRADSREAPTSVVLTLETAAGRRQVRVRVVDGHVTLRPQEGEPWRIPAELAEGATLWVDGLSPYPEHCVSVPATVLPEPVKGRR